MTPWQWWATDVFSESEGTWSEGEFADKGSAIAAGRKAFPGEHFYIIEARSSEARKHEGADVMPFLKRRNKELVYNPPAPPAPPPPPPPPPVPVRTWHGTANQAIEWVLHVNRDGQEQEFLSAWQCGDAQEDWPEFYAWLDRQPDERPPEFEHWTCATGHIKAERALRIVEQMSRWDGLTADAIESIEHLCDRAGPAFARKELETHHNGGLF